MTDIRKRNRWIREALLVFLLTLLIGGVVPGARLGRITPLAAVKNGWSTSGLYYYKNGKKLTGLQKIGKKTYYFAASGKLVKNKRAYVIKVNGKKAYFNLDDKGVAKQWTGTAALAARKLVALKANLNTVTDKKQLKALKKSFLWASGISYRDNTDDSKKGSEAADYYGTYAFKTNTGDCNTQAYAFAWMAKVLGYAPKVIKGHVPDSNGRSPHTWVVIKINGDRQVFDPNFNATYRSQFGKYCGFGFHYGDKNTYKYDKSGSVKYTIK